VALAYYTRAHLEFLCETLAASHPDAQFVPTFLAQLHQALHMRRASPFSAAQTDLFRQVAQRIVETAGVKGSFEDWRDDITRQADEVLAALQRSESP
jgi:hypothetical protein